MSMTLHLLFQIIFMVVSNTSVREALKQFNPSFRTDINKFKINLNNTWEHELAKFKLFWELRKQGHDLVVEGIFLNGQRADLTDVTDGTIFEILKTETVKKAKEKIKSYHQPRKPSPLGGG